MCNITGEIPVKEKESVYKTKGLVMKQFNILNKNKAKEGPWKDEPDLVFWTDPETGYECHIKRHSVFGFWRGYVDAPFDNELERAKEAINKAQQHYDNLLNTIGVHGGITFEDDIGKGMKKYGFDCGHCYDYSPLTDTDEEPSDEIMLNVYRDKEYAINECTNLAKQLKKFDLSTQDLYNEETKKDKSS